MNDMCNLRIHLGKLGKGICVKAALGAVTPPNHRHRITFRNEKSVVASVNLDRCFQYDESNANRWDYIVEYHNEEAIYFICFEIHHLTPNEIGKLNEKLKWLTEKIRDCEVEKEIYFLPTNRDFSIFYKRFSKHHLFKDFLKWKNKIPPYDAASGAYCLDCEIVN